MNGDDMYHVESSNVTVRSIGDKVYPHPNDFQLLLLMLVEDDARNCNGLTCLCRCMYNRVVWVSTLTSVMIMPSTSRTRTAPFCKT